MTTRAPAVLKLIIPKRTKYEYEILGGYLCFHLFGRNFGIFLAHQKYQCYAKTMVGEETEGGKEEEGNMSSWRDEETNEGKIELVSQCISMEAESLQ